MINEDFTMEESKEVAITTINKNKIFVIVILSVLLGILIGLSIGLYASQQFSKNQAQPANVPAVNLLEDDTSKLSTPTDDQEMAVQNSTETIQKNDSLIFPSPGINTNTNETVKLHREQQWLTESQYSSVLSNINLNEAAVNSELGAPYLAIDWTQQADSGSMIAVGFANFHSWGSRWGAINIIYSTYDFSIGAEFDIYATSDDYQQIKTAPNNEVLVVDNNKAFVTYRLHPFFQVIEKQVVFPFQNHYLAVVYHFRTDSPNNQDTLNMLNNGIYPESEKASLETFDSLVNSLQFTVRQ